MKYKNYEERRLLNRYKRHDDGSVSLEKPYCKSSRDEAEVMQRDCLAYDRDLSVLPPDKKEKYLSFEQAYMSFYRLWTGSGDLPSSISRALDLIQADMESLRKEIDDVLENEDGAPAYSPRKKIK